MIVDTIRNGKAVSIEVKDNRIVAANVNNFRPPKGETPTKPSVVLAKRTEAEKLNGKRDHTHIDLGLAILCSKEGFEKYGSGHTLETIASFCNCPRQAIERIEKKALRKLRLALYRDKQLSGELQIFFNK